MQHRFSLDSPCSPMIYFLFIQLLPNSLTTMTCPWFSDKLFLCSDILDIASTILSFFWTLKLKSFSFCCKSLISLCLNLTTFSNPLWYPYCFHAYTILKSLCFGSSGLISNIYSFLMIFFITWLVSTLTWFAGRYTSVGSGRS